MQKQFNQGLNAIILPTINNYYYYYLPCSFTFNSYQTTYYGQYCYDNYGRWDTTRIMVTKGYFDSSSAFWPLTQCNFVLEESYSMTAGRVVEEKKQPAQ